VAAAETIGPDSKELDGWAAKEQAEAEAAEAAVIKAKKTALKNSKQWKAGTTALPAAKAKHAAKAATALANKARAEAVAAYTVLELKAEEQQRAEEQFWESLDPDYDHRRRYAVCYNDM